MGSSLYYSFAPGYGASGSQYLTPSGLNALARYESSGDPLAHSSSSSASGLYGFLNSTWNAYAPQAGVDTALYPTAASAPASVQTQVAAITPVSNWTCQGCDPAFTNALSNNPAWLSSTPNVTSLDAGTGDNIDSGFTPSSTLADNYINPSIFGATDLPSISGLTGQTAGSTSTGSGSGFFSNVFSVIGNFFVRSGLVVVGIILVGIALWAMVSKTKAAENIRATVKKAAEA